MLPTLPKVPRKKTESDGRKLRPGGIGAGFGPLPILWAYVRGMLAGGGFDSPD